MKDNSPGRDGEGGAAEDAQGEAPQPASRFRIIDMPHVDFWEEKRKLPRFLFPFEYSLDPCSTCVGYCCQTVVHVTLVEVLRIVLPIGLAVDDVVERIPADGARGHLQTVPLPLDEGDVRLVLRQRGEPKSCVFQHHVGARGLCSVHALRPGVCRIFPYRVDVGDRIVSAGAPVACPTRWLFNESVENRVEADMRQWQGDVEEEKALVVAWREAEVDDRSFHTLVRFAIERLGARFGVDPKELLRPARRRLGELPTRPLALEQVAESDTAEEPR